MHFMHCLWIRSNLNIIILVKIHVKHNPTLFSNHPDQNRFLEFVSAMIDVQVKFGQRVTVTGFRSKDVNDLSIQHPE